MRNKYLIRIEELEKIFADYKYCEVCGGLFQKRKMTKIPVSWKRKSDDFVNDKWNPIKGHEKFYCKNHTPKFNKIWQTVDDDGCKYYPIGDDYYKVIAEKEIRMGEEYLKNKK